MLEYAKTYAFVMPLLEKRLSVTFQATMASSEKRKSRFPLKVLPPAFHLAIRFTRPSSTLILNTLCLCRLQPWAPPREARSPKSALGL